MIDADTLEEKVFLMQVFFERLIIPKFRMIAKSSPGTVLENLCNRLAIDDGIHHGAGVAYERVLLRTASKKTKGKLVKAANVLLPVFVEHELWRPRERAWIGSAMRTADIARLRNEVDHGVRLARSLGVDVGDVQLPVLRVVLGVRNDCPRGPSVRPASARRLSQLAERRDRHSSGAAVAQHRAHLRHGPPQVADGC